MALLCSIDMTHDSINVVVLHLIDVPAGNATVSTKNKFLLSFSDCLVECLTCYDCTADMTKKNDTCRYWVDGNNIKTEDCKPQQLYCTVIEFF